MATKRKVRTTEDILKEQKADAERDRKRAVVPAATTALSAGGANNWLEIGAELDKYLGAPLAKFTKQGEYAISDIDTIPLGSRAIARTDLIELGYVKWADGKPTGDRKVGLVADGFVPPPKDKLPDRDESQWEIQDNGERRDPWSFQMSVPITRLDAGGETYQFTVGSKGGLRCLSALTRTYGKRVAEKKPGLPIVELQSDSYKHRVYGKIFFPVMHVVGWTGADGKPESISADLSDAIPDFDEKAA
jgi:hypothetical protein